MRSALPRRLTTRPATVEVLALWLVFSALVGALAAHRNRGSITWFFVSCVVSPLIGLIAVMCLSPGTPHHTVRPCPFCAEPILRAAVRCKNCHADVQPMPVERVTRR